MPNKVIVTKVEATGHRLQVEFNCSGQIRKFFQLNQFIVEYNVDIEAVPEEILIIPFLATVSPIIWANQEKLYIKTVDGMFLDSLEKVKKSLQAFYLRLTLGGMIQVKKIGNLSSSHTAKSMMLFSGGIDSLATYIRHQKEQLTLVHVISADILQQKNGDRKTEIAEIRQFSIDHNLSFRRVSSNFMAMVDGVMLTIFDKDIAS